MDATGAQEVLMPALIPEEVYEQSGRRALIGSSMFSLKDRFDRYESLDDIDPRYYPVNLSLDNLPDNLLIVIRPRGDKVKEFNETLELVIEKINHVKVKNVLLLYGNDAYQMDHGVLVIDGEVINEKISVEDAMDWIESNR